MNMNFYRVYYEHFDIILKLWMSDRMWEALLLISVQTLCICKPADTQTYKSKQKQGGSNEPLLFIILHMINSIYSNTEIRKGTVNGFQVADWCCHLVSVGMTGLVSAGERVFYGVPFVRWVVVFDAALHVLQLVQHGKHVDKLPEGQQVRLGDKVLPALGVTQTADLAAETIDGCALRENKAALEDLETAGHHQYLLIKNVMIPGSTWSSSVWWLQVPAPRQSSHRSPLCWAARCISPEKKETNGKSRVWPLNQIKTWLLFFFDWVLVTADS